MLTDGTVSARGAAVTNAFDAWISEKQKERGNALKQLRLYTEETGRAKAAPSVAPGEGRANRPRDKRRGRGAGRGEGAAPG